MVFFLLRHIIAAFLYFVVTKSITRSNLLHFSILVVGYKSHFTSGIQMCFQEILKPPTLLPSMSSSFIWELSKGQLCRWSLKMIRRERSLWKRTNSLCRNKRLSLSLQKQKYSQFQQTKGKKKHIYENHIQFLPLKSPRILRTGSLNLYKHIFSVQNMYFGHSIT